MNLFAFATLWFIVGAIVYAYTEVTLASIKAKVEIERIKAGKSQ